MRLKSEIWVSAYLRRCAIESMPAVLRKRGAADAGAIFVLIDYLDGRAILYGPAPQSLFSEEGGERLFAPVPLSPEGTVAGAEMRLKQEASFDPDMWVIEVEEREGRHFLDLAVDLDNSKMDY